MKQLFFIVIYIFPFYVSAQDSLVVVNSTQDTIFLSRQDLLNILKNDSLSRLKSDTIEVKKINYVIPKLTIKISPLHFFGDHPFNSFPSYNIGIEQRLKKESNSIYHEIGYIGYKVGISPGKILSYITDSDAGSFLGDNIISNKGFRIREQLRNYFYRGEKVFVFFGAEAYYIYQDTEIGEWGWVDDGFGGYDRYYIFNNIKKAMGVNPVFGFSFFSKEEEFKKSKNRFTTEIYFGLGINFIVKEHKNVPTGISKWSWSEGG
ncbi:MAG: hypothetical protein OEW67_13510, partial [Cyclobacteriaceae bacterium]|nr:hypothetical protein [Cyclobacteriaceae bacterium]